MTPPRPSDLDFPWLVSQKIRGFDISSCKATECFDTFELAQTPIIIFYIMCNIVAFRFVIFM